MKELKDIENWVRNLRGNLNKVAQRYADLEAGTDNEDKAEKYGDTAYAVEDLIDSIDLALEGFKSDVEFL